MIKLMLADDEPLVCVGLKSMLKWEEYGVEIIGTSRNGQEAAEMIERLKPDIVVADIKMPLKTGLELAEECAEKYGNIPLFIILTSYSDFELMRKAIRAHVVDYLVKLELTAESLSESISKAVSILAKYHRMDSQDTSPGRGSMQVLYEKFFLRLYNNLFENEEQYLAQKEELGINFSASAYLAAACKIEQPVNRVSSEKFRELCGNTVQIVRETLGKTFRCYIMTLDASHFSIAFCLGENDIHAVREALEEDLLKTITFVHNYFNVPLKIAVGHPVEHPRRLDSSYSTAGRILRYASADRPLLFFRSYSSENPDSAFVFSEIRLSVRKAFEELDVTALRESLTKIINHYIAGHDLRLEAMDTACNVLYMAISLLPDGENTLERIFGNEPGGYRCIYHMNTTDSIVDWLVRMRDGCCALLSSQRQSYTRKIVGEVQAYIRENLDKRLSLNGVAAIFNISPNYLSSMFARHSEGFVEYITATRIEAAKAMLARGEGRIYEIAERVGFESIYYFSKVFKKVVGIPPREYVRKMNAQSADSSGEVRRASRA